MQQQQKKSIYTLFFLLHRLQSIFAFIFVFDFGVLCLGDSHIHWMCMMRIIRVLIPFLVVLFWGDKLFFPLYIPVVVHTVCLPNQATWHVHNSSLLSVSDRCWPNKSLPETLTSHVLEHKHSQSHSVNILNESIVICQWWLWPDLTPLICNRLSVSHTRSWGSIHPVCAKNIMTVYCHNESHIISIIKGLITLN